MAKGEGYRRASGCPRIRVVRLSETSPKSKVVVHGVDHVHGVVPDHERVHDHGLSITITVPITIGLSNKNGKPTLRRATSNDLTTEGVTFAATAGKKWFGSKRAFMHPENTTMLQRLLTKQRGE